jgi:hypothetical protein
VTILISIDDNAEFDGSCYSVPFTHFLSFFKIVIVYKYRYFAFFAPTVRFPRPSIQVTLKNGPHEVAEVMPNISVWFLHSILKHFF